MRRVPLSVLLLVFALIGLAAGLSYAWLIAPGAETNQAPAQLNAADRDAYLRLMADSYAATGDRAAAARRLAALGPDGERALLDLLAAGLRSGATTPGSAAWWSTSSARCQPMATSGCARIWTARAATSNW